MNQGERSYNLLIVEDNSGDALLIRRALKDSRYIRNIEVMEDGADAIESLGRMVEDFPASLPDIILLDLTLPKRGGFEFLSWIKNHQALKSIPVVVLTGSGSPDDIVRSYDLGANAFVRKPIGYKNLYDMLKAFEEFWFGAGTLPVR